MGGAAPVSETPTVNYGWTKPDIGASDDTWGDKWNANLDGIDAQIRDRRRRDRRA